MKKMTDYDNYEKECMEIRRRNEELLCLFEEDLLAKGLKIKTIRNHLLNASLYINEYLLREETHPMEEGPDYLNGFFQDFFIRKCMWYSPATIRSTAASIKKFYRSMKDHEILSEEIYADLCEEIKESLEDWQADCEAYDSGNWMFWS